MKHRLFTATLSLALFFSMLNANATVIGDFLQVNQQATEIALLIENVAQTTTSATNLGEMLDLSKNAINTAKNLGIKLNYASKLVAGTELLYRDTREIISLSNNIQSIISDTDFSTLAASASTVRKITTSVPACMSTAAFVEKDIEDLVTGYKLLVEKSTNPNESKQAMDKCIETIDETHEKLEDVKNHLKELLSQLQVWTPPSKVNIDEAFDNTKKDEENDTNLEKAVNDIINNNKTLSKETESAKTATIESLTKKVKNSDLTDKVFTITQYILVGIAVIFLAVAFVRRNKGERQSNDAIFKVLLWLFLIFMILDLLQVLFK